MGKSAKLYKRVKKTKLPGGALSNSRTAAGTSTQTQLQAAKKKASLKDKTGPSKSQQENREGPVLGGADYVSLLMGGRRKAREEAAKLPVSKD